MYHSLSQSFEARTLTELSIHSLLYRISKGIYIARNLNLRVKLKTPSRVLDWLWLKMEREMGSEILYLKMTGKFTMPTISVYIYIYIYITLVRRFV